MTNPPTSGTVLTTARSPGKTTTELVKRVMSHPGTPPPVAQRAPMRINVLSRMIQIGIMQNAGVLPRRDAYGVPF